MTTSGGRPVTASTARIRPARVATGVALALGTVISLSACSAGQISQTATQVAAVNGNGADQGTVSLRNVHVAYPSSDEFVLEPGGRAELIFTAINTSETTPDRITGIETEGAAEVVVTGATGGTSIEIPAQASVASGVPADQDPTAPEGSQSITAVMEDLSENVRPGLTVPVTFTFQQAGDVTVSVPVDPGPVTPRLDDEANG
ncbi:hypothetical protein HQ305_14160 [Rhodococcus sp. BP-149]|nr:hypothetical protein [Rhodococcus sp. BP-332]MBY6682027.1 hypothetical protein [Rhodococcus sp. BP-316]MBY6686703.1 hypothetical protein [Rhodococcus sp. BP-288]MBY6695565.1 hypothetical protein [Rhodococcus sp. BP-188]MBY6700195.1 hypothetical protein [Rhodococcus sp. BP-285]MBY6704782.1 hypothetical protein [Rhodococcus sp. BP-283]MBY6713320.1 hypothetical protein [Rhodococcus sp. BP-160]MBY6714485.1 hypothetical protein [Rhodococcus sp. BP-110]MBY6721530.1 hypothetical protein [Rhodoc